MLSLEQTTATQCEIHMKVYLRVCGLGQDGCHSVIVPSEAVYLHLEQAEFSSAPSKEDIVREGQEEHTGRLCSF